MPKKPTEPDFFKRLLNQALGDVRKKDKLIPEYCIEGTGHMWCYDPVEKKMQRVARGTKVYVIEENFDDIGRYLVYTERGHTVCMDPDELILTGFD